MNELNPVDLALSVGSIVVTKAIGVALAVYAGLWVWDLWLEWWTR